MRQWSTLIRQTTIAILLLSVMSCGVLDDPQPAFQTTAVTFVTADEGWILGYREGCGKATCKELFHTTDGGQSWRKSTPPPFAVTRLVFADSRNGWAYHPGTGVERERELYSTHDGGGSWHRVGVPVGMAPTEWTDPVISDGTVQIALFDPRTSEVRMLSSPVGVDTFTASQPFQIDVASSAHRSTYVELGLTRAGSSSWFVVMVSSPDNSQSPAGGARFVDGSWSSWTLPCVNPNPPRLAAVSQAELIATCAVAGEADPSSGEFHLFSSTDSGVTFTDLGALAPPRIPAKLIGATSTHDLVVVMPTGDGDAPTALRTTHDGGRTWATTLNPRTDMYQTPTLAKGGFFTPELGFAVLEYASVPDREDRLYLTHDGGDTWTQVTPD
ncbi:hypothetical protein ACWF82_28060 [Nocardia sp. NPDC055053]